MRVVVAMSGGVDSSVTAALLKEEGYEVIGITMQLYDHGAMIGKKGACCAGQDIYDAKTVANQLGIKHYILDYESLFKKNVIDDFADTYLAGYTPIPCIKCNQSVKFRDLLGFARDLDAHFLATGHYVRRIEIGDSVELHRGLNTGKDQSYFLFGTTYEQLKFLRFPLGGMTKEETRIHAKRFNLSVSDKPDSQDICFVPSGGYADVVKKLRPDACDPGEIVHVDGSVLGKHEGIIHFTVGQRKGIGVSSREPLYVIKLNAEKKEVIVGPQSALSVSSLRIGQVNWLTHHEGECLVKIRSSHTCIPAYIKSLPENLVEVHFMTPEYGVAPGQACVFYKDSQVLGGGWILPY